MTDLIDTTEMYLRTLLELEEEGTPLLRARIAERLGHSGPTVSQTVARMERDGLVHLQPDRSLVFTSQGRLRATRVMRKHRLAERLLVDVIGLEYEHVHAEACRWEHVMSDRVERKILTLLPTHDTSPYGNPIPGLEELGVSASSAAPQERPEGMVHLTDIEAPSGRVRLRRVGEPLQTDKELLSALAGAGVLPGAMISYEQLVHGGVLVQGEGDAGDAVEVPSSVASLLFVTQE
ncbi:DtxR family Mn-dependent transcriptional regulator [Kineosphaera limosa]|uniref:Iron-dependent repressor n=1 Tax=Kineosphaera limosa NBRC 100340 TaxID=1184609 RepID=K6WF11_9MICO|nr:metal-dependent transcriptional regulator [Kineosphaera limosa]NYD99621.1 DtxR family Mn-dependent transcriptional regulator [Kineosphaera limosa]GAB97860.1 iron-dependent repressor [Kineosphaera limosa NBRC 100340]